MQSHSVRFGLFGRSLALQLCASLKGFSERLIESPQTVAVLKSGAVGGGGSAGSAGSTGVVGAAARAGEDGAVSGLVGLFRLLKRFYSVSTASAASSGGGAAGGGVTAIYSVDTASAPSSGGGVTAIVLIRRIRKVEAALHSLLVWRFS